MLKSFLDRYLPNDSTHCKFQNFNQEPANTNSGIFNVANNLYDLHSKSNYQTPRTKATKPVDCKSHFLKPQHLSVHFQVQNNTMNCFWKSSENIIGERPMGFLTRNLPFFSQFLCNDLVSGLSRSAPGALERKTELITKEQHLNKNLYKNIESTTKTASFLTETCADNNQVLSTFEPIPVCKIKIEKDCKVQEQNSCTKQPTYNRSEETAQKTMQEEHTTQGEQDKPNVCQNPLIAYIIGCNETNAIDNDSDWSEWDENESDWTEDELRCFSHDLQSVTSDYSSTDSISSENQSEIISTVSGDSVEDKLEAEHDFSECEITFERPRCTNSFISFILNWSDAEDETSNENEINSCKLANDLEPDKLWDEFQQTSDPYALIGGKALEKCEKEYRSLSTCNKRQSCTSNKKVRFDDDVEVHHMFAWSFAYRDARKGHWESCARDADRFRTRITSLEKIISRVLETQHRHLIYNKYFVNQISS